MRAYIVLLISIILFFGLLAGFAMCDDAAIHCESTDTTIEIEGDAQPESWEQCPDVPEPDSHQPVSVGGDPDSRPTSDASPNHERSTPISGPTTPILPTAPELDRRFPERGPEPRQPLRITEYMVRDWTAFGGGGQPQWIELHNPNAESITLTTFEYAYRAFANAPWEIIEVPVVDFEIPAGGVVILATQQVNSRRYSGIEESQVYVLRIPNRLKNGWRINGDPHLSRGAVFEKPTPIAPKHEGGKRVSHHVLPSESPAQDHYYGSWADVGSPGFYEEVAPRSPTHVHKKVGLWVELKRK